MTKPELRPGAALPPFKALRASRCHLRIASHISSGTGRRLGGHFIRRSLRRRDARTSNVQLHPHPIPPPHSQSTTKAIQIDRAAARQRGLSPTPKLCARSARCAAQQESSNPHPSPRPRDEARKVRLVRILCHPWAAAAQSGDRSGRLHTRLSQPRACCAYVCARQAPRASVGPTGRRWVNSRAASNPHSGCHAAARRGASDTGSRVSRPSSPRPRP